MKDYYCYVRPMVPDAPWKLEKVPVDRNVVTKSAIEVKSGKYLAFERIESDKIEITLNKDGSLTLPAGRYIVQFTANVELPVAGLVMLSINNYPIYHYLSQASTPSTISGSTLVESTGKNEFGVKNEGKDTINITNAILIITRLN